jgi:hypothetical protein
VELEFPANTENFSLEIREKHPSNNGELWKLGIVNDPFFPFCLSNTESTFSCLVEFSGFYSNLAGMWA